MVLTIICIFSIFTQPALAYSLDLDYYVKNKKDDGYPSNNGKWTIDYVNTVYKEGVITKSEKTKYSKKSEYPTLYDVLTILNKLEETQSIDDSKSVIPKKIPNHYKKVNINKATFSRYLTLYLMNSNDTKVNSVEVKDIKDVNEKTIFYKDIVNVLEYGLLGLSGDKFYPQQKLKNSDLMQAIASIINPYYRQTFKLYNGDNIVVQSKEFPMYYINKDEGINIEINHKREYDTDYFVAKIVLDKVSHFKTIYSNLGFSNYGMEINLMNEKIDPIFIVNGDFRSPYIVRDKDLGIIRHGKIVRDMKFNNILGMKKDGTLIAIKEDNAQSVLDLDIRDTWTFGPWLVRNGKAIEGLENKTHHPRTFIGQKYRDDNILEYYIIVAEGRSKSDAGLTNYEMAQILEGLGVDIGYNLDGGGSSVMMFDDKLITRPSGNYFRADIDYIYIK